MAFIVCEPCRDCKYTDCVVVCPTDCSYQDEAQLYIDPESCIDCEACVPECPVEAIKPDTEPGLEEFLKLNADFAKIWPNITTKKAPPPDHKEFEGVADKFEKFFSPNPGTGD